ncbi:MAG: RNA degradosome polyphosphate kinase [Clostridia bacterium]|nr:RNA degradosome polyphosphate kinase [Clostridia bacterium]MBQ2348046.1 RNA degradosome polyphosphate kinase [Clostridia bacterium]
MDENYEKGKGKKFPYNNRQLSWMDFNTRVIEEAFEKENPIMERVKFLAITASNLDEFMMVRVAGVIDQMEHGVKNSDLSGLTPKQLYNRLSEKIHSFSEQQYNCLNRSILPVLKKHDIYIKKISELNEEQKAFCDKYFDKVIFPVLTPLAVDPSRPFPLLLNKSLNLAVRLMNDDKETFFAVMQVPSVLPRFIELPAKGERDFVLLENIIISRLDELFELFKIKACCPFRITRDSDLDIDEDTDNLMTEIEKSIKQRRRGKPIRLEIKDKCDKQLRKFLVEMLGVDESEIYPCRGPLDLTFLSKFGGIKGCEKLLFKPIKPVDPPPDFYGYDDIFEAIREKDRFVHHPYDSFDCVVRFVRDAAKDEKVLAIKQTLYRVSGNSPVVDALIKAAENGKQVTVLVELKARFDEENNIAWARKLEKAGCHVIYGLSGLKTHCKICLVVRSEDDGIRRYLHMGTGNYNDSTARFYTDMGLFTCKEEYGEDASSLFNVLTGYSLPPQYNKFVVAPHGMRTFFEDKIRQEIENAKNGLPSGITVKINALVDPAIIQLLYNASMANVPVKLIVRGICCLIPGIEGVSTNITVHSIVGQLLEHSRMFKFENGGRPEMYLGSADWMPRNLDRRVELVFPVEDEEIYKRCDDILNVLWHDNINTRIQLSDTTYVMADKRGKKHLNCQTEFSQLTRKALLHKVDQAAQNEVKQESR